MIKIPTKWDNRLKKNIHYHTMVTGAISQFSALLDNDLFFFPEYTDHGILHLKNTLDIAYRFIDQNAYDSSRDEKGLCYKNISVLVLSILLHDLGMHITFEGFHCLLTCKKYAETNQFRKKSWLQLWEDYFQEAKRWNDQQKYLIFGDIVNVQDIPNEKGMLNEYHKMLCGEFLRRNHHLLAFDIAKTGYPLKDQEVRPYISIPSECDHQLNDIIGLIAYSHGIKLWDAVDLLNARYKRDQVRSCNGIKIPFIMAVLRISDLFDITADRANKTIFNTNRLLSPISSKEWLRHHCIENIDMTNSDDPELIYIGLNAPPNSEIYLYVEDLLNYIQYEMDIAWAVIGRIYGQINKKLKLTYRRIDSNLKNIIVINDCKYVAEQINLNINRATLELLVGPLYQYEQSYGIRELIQNAVDACLEKKQIIKSDTQKYEATINIEIRENSKGGVFIIKDNGIGMDLNTIKNYYLIVGATYRKSKDWKESYTLHGNSTVARNGRFGVGVLAGFLLGDTIHVNTFKHKENAQYNFIVNQKMTQIEIIKEDVIYRQTSGTEICININRETLEHLKNQYKDPNIGERDTVNWCNWYYGLDPVLNIIVPNAWKNNKYMYKMDITENATQGNWATLYPSNFEKLEYRFSNDNNQFLFYNGIIIPNYIFEDNLLYWPLLKPAISIVDNNANLVFDLQRTQVIEMPFKQELFEDIYKDIFFRLLPSQPIENFSLTSDYFQLDRFELKHNSFSRSQLNNNIYKHYIYTKEGFSICHRYFIQKLKIDNIMIVEMDCLCKSINKNLLNEYTIFIDSRERFDLHTISGFHCTGFDLIPLVKFMPLKNISLYPKARRLNESLGYISYDPNFKITRDIKNRVEHMPLDIKEFGYFRCELNKEVGNFIEFGFFEKLLLDYLGEEPLIPHDIDQRKKKFGAAFDAIKQDKTRYNKYAIKSSDFVQKLDEFYGVDDYNDYDNFGMNYDSEDSDGWRPDFFDNLY